MTITPEMVAYLRTMVKGHHVENDRVEERLDANDWNDFPRFLAALFFLAVDRRFGEDASRADVIQFVAEMRAELGHDAPNIDADQAETLIMSTIDPTVGYDIDPQMIGRIQAATVHKVLGEDSFTDQGLDAILAEAVELAERP
ncbi:hypothetical protein [Micromonospora zhanjiangensis]|uniref:Uncharacterized protein n=1 Tax=Micromonospora zhanjiangensis TaxID=1522057 RepID=A0ABV8KVW9_9ACTN